MIFNYEFMGLNNSHTKYVIYLITNTISNRFYVGQTRREIRKRWDDYKRDLLNPVQITKRIGSNIKLKNSFQKHFNELGHTDFLQFSILEVVDITNLITDEEKQQRLNEREIFLIREYRKLHGKNNVFNVKDGGNTYTPLTEDKLKMSNSLTAFYQSEEGIKNKELRSRPYEEKFGIEKSEEIKQKMSEAHRGENNHNFNRKFGDNFKKQISNFLNTLFQSKEGEAIKQKMSEKKREYFQTEEGERLKQTHKDRLSGKTYEEIHGVEKAEELKQNISKRMTGENHPLFGKSVSLESRRKMSDSHRGKFVGSEHPGSKTYDLSQNPLVSPAGIVFTEIICLAEFCKQYSLEKKNMHQVINGKRKSCNGWKMKHYNKNERRETINNKDSNKQQP